MFAWAKILIGSMTLCQILEATLFNSARNSDWGLLFLDDGVRLSWFGAVPCCGSVDVRWCRKHCGWFACVAMSVFRAVMN